MNQAYTVTDMSLPTYTHPDWDISPQFCTFTLSYEETKLPGDETAISRTDKTFTFAFNDELDYVNDKQTVTITATSQTIYTQLNAPIEDQE